MAKHERVTLTMEDVLDYTDAVQVMYNVRIVLELSVGVMGTTGKWRVTAKAFECPSEPLQESVLSEGVNYPSHSFKTFPGAAMNAVMKLEQHLQAWYYLRQMGFPSEA